MKYIDIFVKRHITIQTYTKIHRFVNYILKFLGFEIKSKINIVNNQKLDKLVSLINKAKEHEISSQELKQIISNAFSTEGITITGLNQLIDDIYGGKYNAR